MGAWTWLLLASAVAFATKFSGYLLPPRWLAGPRMARMAGVLTVGLLAALVAVNTAADSMRVCWTHVPVPCWWPCSHSGCARRSCWWWCWAQWLPRCCASPGWLREGFRNGPVRLASTAPLP